MKKFFLYFLVLVFGVGLFGGVVFGDEGGFSDVGGGDAEILFLKDSGVVKGRSEGSFAPLEEVNRAEMMKILLESVGVSPDGSVYRNCFPDVGEEWFARYVCYGKSKGFISGYDDGLFRPGDFVNLAEALKMSFNVFGFELSDVEGGEWYSKFLNVARNYDVVGEEAPGVFVSRELMAKIAVKSGVVKVTGGRFVSGDLGSIRKFGVQIQDFFDVGKGADIKESLDKVGDVVVTVTSVSDKRFKFVYGDDVYESFWGALVVEKDPIISVFKEGAEFGLNSDFVFDGDVGFVNGIAKLRADADLSGFYGKSINVDWVAQKSLVISDKLGKRNMRVDLTSGAVSGDEVLTKGFSNLSGHFPFEVCVSDYDGYVGGITILSLNSVSFGGCSYSPKLVKASLAEKVKLLSPPGVFKPALPIFPLPKGTTKGGGAVSDDGKVGVVETPFEVGEVEGVESSSEENEKIFNETISTIEGLMKDAGVAVPSDVPKFDPSVCCPSYAKEGKCCTDLDLNSKEGRAEYLKMINCL